MTHRYARKGTGGAHLGLALELDGCLAAAGTSTLLACLTGAVNPPWTVSLRGAPDAPSKLDQCADNLPS
jgi:hypothetical protein